MLGTRGICYADYRSGHTAQTCAMHSISTVTPPGRAAAAMQVREGGFLGRNCICQTFDEKMLRRRLTAM
jgi:hypothetical protein